MLNTPFPVYKTINIIQEIHFCIKDAVSKTGNPLHDTFLNILARDQCRAIVLMITKKEVFTEKQIFQQQYAATITKDLFQLGVGILIIDFSFKIMTSPFKQCKMAYFM